MRDDGLGWFLTGSAKPLLSTLIGSLLARRGSHAILLWLGDIDTDGPGESSSTHRRRSERFTHRAPESPVTPDSNRSQRTLVGS